MSVEASLEGPNKAERNIAFLFDEFEDLAFRYLDLQDEKFQSVPDDEIDDYLWEAHLLKSYLELLRLPSKLPHALLEECRGRDWYKGDRESLSRHIALLALVPEAADREKVPGLAGELTSRLLEERKALSRHYPHLYALEAPGAPAGTDREGHHSLFLEVVDGDMEQSGLSEDEWEDLLMGKERIGDMTMAIQDVDPFWLEESSAVWSEVRGASAAITSENGTGLTEGIADAIGRDDPAVRSLLARFVLESLMFRLMQEDGVEDLDKLLEKWTGLDRPGPGALRSITREEADRSLDLMERMFSQPVAPYRKMMEAARHMAQFEDADSSWNMVQAVLSRCAEEGCWSEMALRGVLVEMMLDHGRQEELARALLARGEEEGSPRTVAAGSAAMALALHSLGRSEESAKYRDRMMRDLLAGRDDPNMLEVYPLAASISLEIGDRKSVRKLAGAGLRNMEAYPELDAQREQLLEMRREVDRVDKGPKKGDAEGPGKGGRKGRPGR